MIRPILDSVSSLKSQLMLMPTIVDHIQRKEKKSIDELTEWLRKTEDILQKLGYAQCAELAGLRGKLLTPEFSHLKRMSKKKEKLRIASLTVYDAQEVISQLLIPLEEKLEEARNIVRQILLAIQPTGMLEVDHCQDMSNIIQGIWFTLRENQHLGGGISKILSLISQTDAMRILAEEISSVQES